MKLELYFIACSIIAIALMRVHSYFNDRYSGAEFYQQKAEQAYYQLEQKDLEMAKLRFEDQIFEQKIASYMPELQKKDSYKARNIASVLGNQSLELPKDQVEEVLKDAKAYFSDGNFLSAINKLEKLETEHPSDPRAPEIVYLLMESYHQTDSYKKATNKINKLLQLYPESYLSGYALIRLGDYYKKEDEVKSAIDAYDLAIENFSFDEQILSLAKKKKEAL